MNIVLCAGLFVLARTGQDGCLAFVPQLVWLPERVMSYIRPNQILLLQFRQALRIPALVDIKLVHGRSESRKIELRRPRLDIQILLYIPSSDHQVRRPFCDRAISLPQFACPAKSGMHTTPTRAAQSTGSI